MCTAHAFSFSKAFSNTHISVIPGRDTLTQAANTEFRTRPIQLHARRRKTICSTSSRPHIIPVSLYQTTAVSCMCNRNNCTRANFTCGKKRVKQEERQRMTEKEAQRNRSYRVCVYFLPLGFMAEEKWRILGKLMNTHGMQAHMHSHNPPTHFFSSLWGYPFLSTPLLSLSILSL